MNEIINTYDLDNLETVIPMDRKEFYKEQKEIFKKTWKSTKCVEGVAIFIFNENWELILQRRSSKKLSNPRKIDKSVWWHLKYWYSSNFTAQIETLEELWIPSIILEKGENFDEKFLSLKKYLTKTSLIQHIYTKIRKVYKKFENEEIKIAYKTNLYVWIYSWSIKNIDWEVDWIFFEHLLGGFFQ